MTYTRSYNILNASQFSKQDVEILVNLTDKIRKYNKTKEGLQFLSQLLSHKRAMLYFTQPSTRTFLSFQSACHILGIKTSEIRDPETSSERKGESIEDSLRTFSSYVDIIIMRSPVPNLCEKMASLLSETQRPVPLINAGSGPDEHPTQALLDLYTLKRGFSPQEDFNGKQICLVGDLKRGRTIRSLAKLLALYKGVHLIFCSPHEFSIKDDLRSFLKQIPDISFEETTKFMEPASEADAIYMTRIQDEYDCIETSSSYDTKQFSLTKENLSSLKKHCMILHPMPRREEIHPSVDQDKRARYWSQERNGMWIRVALLAQALKADKTILSL
ncbi:MAG: aspartate carbamoyltransferase [Zetaproteobacteria bacterium]|nr:aspartate carbamoyltransferase [Pseudobdellovibrionaceae bacterium]